MSSPDAAAEHRRFLNRLYGPSRHVYDLTRRYFLLGRDQALRGLLAEPWSSLVEVGPGTGRNLRRLHAARPGALLGGIEASDAMLGHARARLPWARIVHGFAEEGGCAAVLGRAPERILFSYCLSMVQDPLQALARARAEVAPGGKVVVVDFFDLARLPRLAARGLTGWLRTFHVRPLEPRLLAGAAELRCGPGRYFVVASFQRPAGGGAPGSPCTRIPPRV